LATRNLIFLVMLVILLSSPLVISAQTSPQLEVTMIGKGEGPYYAAAGQVTQFKVEIMNLGPGDVYLIKGEAYLDPNLSGNWQLTHSEDTNNFHLSQLQSAIWTFDLPMPTNIEAANSTNGMPQVILLIQIIYSTANGQHETASKQFSLSVPGATVRHTEYWIWFVAVAGVAVALLAAMLIYRIVRRSKNSSRS